MDNRGHRAIRFSYRQDANYFSLINNRGRHVHHGTFWIAGIVLGAACAVLPAKSQPDIVPARVIFAQAFPGRIKNHAALRVSHVNMIFVANLVNTANVGTERALMQLRKSLRQPTVLRSTGEEIVASHFRQQGGGIDKRPFGGPAHAGFDLLHKDRQHEPRSDGHNQKITQQQTHSDAHYASPRL
ncbi:hypothetical protein D3C76_1202480 [compost metagenome]